jgi:transcriptional regulator with XRE-family HTH domain
MTMSIGERLRYLRYTRDWTKVKLAHEANVPVSTVSLVERGKRPGEALSLETIQRLAHAFGMTVGEFLDEKAEERETSEKAEEVEKVA